MTAKNKQTTTKIRSQQTNNTEQLNKGVQLDKIASINSFTECVDPWSYVRNEIKANTSSLDDTWGRCYHRGSRCAQARTEREHVIFDGAESNLYTNNSNNKITHNNNNKNDNNDNNNNNNNDNNDNKQQTLTSET
ncbi:unnamed protein product [Polarella glacialis]|uniref:Uncharacterized protein n=1 Tax=Polarella glacialis TaxID=89957 RepID=A0A813I8B9_POLGL|nr:unnamed protein product [Polarella glacialis]